MATTAKSKTTKTKPAKKPAKKPAGASVKPKAYKTVKTTNKPATAKAAAKTKPAAKPAKTSKNNHTKNRTCEIFFGVIMIILAVAIIAGVATHFILGSRKNDEIVVVETGNGKQIAATLTALPEANADILIPTDFKKLSAAEIEELKKSEDSEDTNIKVAYANSDKTAVIYFTESDDEATDAEIKQGITDLAKIFKEAGIKDIKTNVKELDDGRSISTIEFSGLSESAYAYQHIAFFSNNGKAASVAFSCTKDLAEDWKKVGATIIDSINFAK